MAKVNIINLKGEKVKDLTINDSIWKVEENDLVLKKALKLQMDSLRQGSADTKDRSEVSGGGRKPYRQKGTGNARQGSTRSPQWPGGGIVFGPKPRKYELKQNRKERRLALRSALSSKLQDKELVVVDSLKLESNKTKAFNEILKNLKLAGKVLIVFNEADENLFLATSNKRNIAVMSSDEVNVLDLVAANYLLIDEASVKKIEEVLK